MWASSIFAVVLGGQRPKTSRRVPLPSPDEFTDYVHPQPDKPHVISPTKTVEVVVFDDGAAAVAPAAVVGVVDEAPSPLDLQGMDSGFVTPLLVMVAKLDSAGQAVLCEEA